MCSQQEKVRGLFWKLKWRYIKNWAALGQAGGQSAVNQIDSPRLKYSSLFTLQYKNIILRSNINTSTLRWSSPNKLTKNVKHRVIENWLKRQRVILHQIERGNWMCPKGGTNCGRAQLKTTMADQADTRPKKKLMCSLIWRLWTTVHTTTRSIINRHVIESSSLLTKIKRKTRFFISTLFQNPRFLNILISVATFCRGA